MGRWNYRIFRDTEPDGTEVYTVREVHYDERGEQGLYGADGARPMGETVEELRTDLERMLMACGKPVLCEADFAEEGEG